MKNRISICSSLLALALTILASISAQAQAFDPLRISGPVTAYTPSDCGKNGSINIAGQTFVIAAGADVVFFDTMQVINSGGFLANANVISEVWQIVGTGRTIGVYLDPQNRIRLQAVAGINTTTTRALDITGAVSEFTAATATTAGSIKVHGLTFAIAPGSTVPAAVSTNLVRVIGTFNSSNQLTITTVGDPYRKISICGAPANYRSTGGFEVGDVNAFDAAGPIAASVGFNTSPVTPFNPLGSTGGYFQCDEGVEVMTVDGAANILVAPNFNMRQQISKDVNACFDLNIDAFGWMSSGSQKATGTGNRISGILESNVLAASIFPTTLNETAQRGSVRISGVTFTVASGNKVTTIGGPVVGDSACLVPVVSEGQTAAFLVGQQSPPRTGQMINGSTLTKGVCIP